MGWGGGGRGAPRKRGGVGRGTGRWLQVAGVRLGPCGGERGVRGQKRSLWTSNQPPVSGPFDRPHLFPPETFSDADGSQAAPPPGKGKAVARSGLWNDGPPFVSCNRTIAGLSGTARLPRHSPRSTVRAPACAQRLVVMADLPQPASHSPRHPRSVINQLQSVGRPTPPPPPPSHVVLLGQRISLSGLTRLDSALRRANVLASEIKAQKDLYDADDAQMETDAKPLSVPGPGQAQAMPSEQVGPCACVMRHDEESRQSA